MKAIETKYKGYRFRSRLEARWAVFLDTLDCEWEYEKEGYDLGELGWYLPDFFVRMSSAWQRRRATPTAGYWLEIKGETPTVNELQRAHALALLTGHHAMIAHGLPGSSLLHFASRESGIPFCYEAEDRWLSQPTFTEALWFDFAVVVPAGLGLNLRTLSGACDTAKSARFGR